MEEENVSGLEYSAYEDNASSLDERNEAMDEEEDEEYTRRFEMTPIPLGSEDATSHPNTDKVKIINHPNMKTFTRICEMLFVGIVLLVIVAFFAIPSVIFAIPNRRSQEQLDPAGSTCTEVEPYSGEICAGLLSSLQTCYSSESFPLNIPSTIDQDEAESTATLFLGALPLLNPSSECLERIRPFLCLQMFGLCDSSNNLRTPTREECRRLRNEICSTEFEIVDSFELPSGTLPLCEDLPDVEDECAGNSSSVIQPQTTPMSDQPLICQEGFFFDKNRTGICRPECGTFMQSSLLSQIITRLSFALGFVVSIVMFILALTLQRKTLLQFPSILLVYLCGTTFVQDLMITVGYFDSTRLFCKSRDQFESLAPGNETTYCKLIGVVFFYCVQQIFLWALLHSIFLFWAVSFPFSFRLLKHSRKRFAHISCVLLALILPIPGALAPLKDGFLNSQNPPIICVARNINFLFYFTVLPISVTVGATSCLFALTSWAVFKKVVLKKLIEGKKVDYGGNAVIKTSLIVLYYIIVGVLNITLLIFYDINQENLTELIICSSAGNQNCDSSVDNVYVVLSVLALVSLGLIPVVVVILSFNRKACSKCRAAH